MMGMNNDAEYLKLDDAISAVYDYGFEIKPALIVEGKTDIDVYGKLLTYSNLEINKYDVIIGDCKSNILTHIEEENIPFQYVALIDSDHERHRGNLQEVDNIIYTHCYDMENYLVEDEVIEKTLRDLTTIFTRNITISTLKQEVYQIILPLYIANKFKIRYMDENKKLFKIEDLSIENQKWWQARSLSINKDKLKAYIKEELEKLDETFNEEIWNTIEMEAYRELDAEKKLIDINLIVKGRRMVESYYFVFKKNLTNQMDQKNKHSFSKDLIKNIHCSLNAQKLLEEIEEKMYKII